MHKVVVMRDLRFSDDEFVLAGATGTFDGYIYRFNPNHPKVKTPSGALPFYSASDLNGLVGRAVQMELDIFGGGMAPRP